MTLIPTYGRLLVTENINCEKCSQRILEVEVCANEKFGQKQAKKIWNVLFNQQCPRCGKLELWPWEDVDGNLYFRCDFCNGDFEKSTTGLEGWFMSRTDGRPEWYPDPKSKFKKKPLEKNDVAHSLTPLRKSEERY